MPIYLDSVDPEYYPNTHTFVNKLNKKDWKKLKSKEADFSVIRSLELLQQPNIISTTFDYNHLKAIHHHLFKDIYSWAGHPRSFDMAKDGDIFTPAKKPPQYENEVFSKSLEFSVLNIRPNKNDVAEKLAKCLGIINTYHPFPEGNGRTQRIFISILARKQDYDIDWKSSTSWEIIETSKAVHQGNYDPLIVLFKRIVIDKLT